MKPCMEGFMCVLFNITPYPVILATADALMPIWHQDISIHHDDHIVIV